MQRKLLQDILLRSLLPGCDKDFERVKPIVSVRAPSIEVVGQSQSHNMVVHLEVASRGTQSNLVEEVVELDLQRVSYLLPDASSKSIPISKRSVDERIEVSEDFHRGQRMETIRATDREGWRPELQLVAPTAGGCPFVIDVERSVLKTEVMADSEPAQAWPHESGTSPWAELANVLFVLE